MSAMRVASLSVTRSTGFLLRWLIAFLGAIVLSSSPASAQSVTRQAHFYPAFLQGQLVGCQVGFSVVRVDMEFSQNRPVLLNGLVVFYGQASGHPGAMLRLGVAAASSPSAFAPPARAFLIDGLRTNAAEAGNSFLSEDAGFRAFPFALGDVTTNAIGRSLADRRFRFSYGVPGSTVDAPFEVDLSEHPEVYRQWLDCMGAVIG